MTTIKKFLVSTADVRAYDSTDALIFTGKTLLDSSISATVTNNDVRAGRGNALQYVYFHSSSFDLNISDAQWNLDYLATSLGQTIATGVNVWTEETVTLAANKGGSVTGTPLVVQGTTVYGWVTHENGDVERVEFSTKAFVTQNGAEGDVVCVRYYALDSAARQLVVPANVIPGIVRLSLDCQLCSSDVSTNVIGSVQIEVPKAQMSGAFEISLTPDGVSSTPLACRALAFTPTAAGCASTAQYATITEIITGALWYTNCIGLSIEGGDFALANAATKQLVIWAIPTSGAPFHPPMADLTFASSDATKATVDAAGLVTWAGAGTTTIKCSIAAKNTIDANCVVTAGA